MSLDERIEAFALLGQKIDSLSDRELSSLYEKSYKDNPWFTQDNVNAALAGISKFLDRDALEKWVSKYKIGNSSKKTGIVMAGNIPLVGFHDLLCVLISGHHAVIKPSSRDTFLMNYIVGLLEGFNSFKQKIHMADKLKDIDAVIATGSDNSARYFNYYFSKYPQIIRKNRTSIAVLDGMESDRELEGLADDVFLYFGQGCRNVSKVFLPETGDPDRLSNCFQKYEKLMDHHKYANNYCYQKSILLVNLEEHLDFGNLLMKEDSSLVSPIGVLYYQHYKDQTGLEESLQEHHEKIQCTLTRNGWLAHSIPFGQAQFPGLEDYADDIDTMEFLTSL